jgi:hypothetical protein
MIRFEKTVLLLAIAAAIPVCLSAQPDSTTTKTPRSVSKVLTIDSAQVVYVSGDDAVLRMPDGSLRLFELAPGTPLMIDGKEAKPSDLSPGMNISHVQLHSQVTADVETVETLSGVITGKSGRFLTLRLDDGTSKIYRVPTHATFNVGGRDTNFNDITRNMRINVTAVTTSGLNSHSSAGKVVATTPPTPPQQGTLLILRRR